MVDKIKINSWNIKERQEENKKKERKKETKKERKKHGLIL